MKYIKLFENFRNHFLSDNILYHYTYIDNLEDILEDGLMINKNPNYNYDDAIFLTNKSSLSSINLPDHLTSELESFLDENEDYEKSELPIVRLCIDTSKLDDNKFRPDDDYLDNRYGWNKAVSKEDKLTESLELWGSIAYTESIPSTAIIKYDFDYYF